MTYSVQTYEANKFYKKIDVAIDATTKMWYYIDVAKTTTNNLGGYHNEKF